MKGKEFYNVAVYLRLSRDDGDVDGSKLETPSSHSIIIFFANYFFKKFL